MLDVGHGTAQATDDPLPVRLGRGRRVDLQGLPVRTGTGVGPPGRWARSWGHPPPGEPSTQPQGHVDQPDEGWDLDERADDPGERLA